jgi:hypothetical protein
VIRQDYAQIEAQNASTFLPSGGPPGELPVPEFLTTRFMPPHAVERLRAGALREERKLLPCTPAWRLSSKRVAGWPGAQADLGQVQTAADAAGARERRCKNSPVGPLFTLLQATTETARFYKSATVRRTSGPGWPASTGARTPRVLRPPERLSPRRRRRMRGSTRPRRPPAPRGPPSARPSGRGRIAALRFFGRFADPLGSPLIEVVLTAAEDR